MAVADCKLIEVVHQHQPGPRHESLALQMDRCLMVLNYESLVRGLKSLHHQLESLAKMAPSATVVLAGVMLLPAPAEAVTL